TTSTANTVTNAQSTVKVVGPVVIPLMQGRRVNSMRDLAGSVEAAEQEYTVIDNYILKPKTDDVYDIVLPTGSSASGIILLKDKEYKFFVDSNNNGIVDTNEKLLDLNENPVKLTTDDKKDVFRVGLKT